MLKKNNKYSAGSILVILMVLALAVRVAVVLTRQMASGDEVVYARMAEQLAQGNGLVAMFGIPTTIFMPLVSLFMAGFYFVLHDAVTAGYIVEVLFGCLLLIPAFYLGRELVGERVGLLTAALLAVLPLAVVYSTRIYTEGVYSFFLVSAAFFGWRMLRGGSLRYAASAGGSLGLAYLANPAGMFYLAAFLVLIMIMAVRAGDRRLWFAKVAIMFLLPFMVFALPYIIFLHGELGKWTYTAKNGSDTIYAATQGFRWFTPEYEKTFSILSEDGTEVVGMKQWESSPDPTRYFLQNPKVYVRIFGSNLMIFYREELPKVLPLWLIPLLGLGLFAAGWDRQRLKAIAYTMLLSSPVLLIFAIENRARFFMPFITFILIWVAAGFDRLQQWAKETVSLNCSGNIREQFVRWAPVAVAVVVLASLLLHTVLDTYREQYKTEYKAAGEWIKANAGSDKRIMDREENAAFYAGGIAVQIPYADYGRSTNYARLQGVDYMIIGKQALLDFRPDLAPLLEGESLHPDWRLVHSEQEGTAREVLVFQLLQ